MNLLTHNEARAFLCGDSLPENFSERLRNFLEFEPCSNCNDVRDMNIVLRRWEEDEPDLCPFCCER